MLRRLLVGLGLAALIALPAAAQTADDVIARNNDAKGGLAKQKAVQSARLTGRATVAPGVEAPIVIRDQAAEVPANRHRRPGPDHHPGLRRRGRLDAEPALGPD